MRACDVTMCMTKRNHLLIRNCLLAITAAVLLACCSSGTSGRGGSTREAGRYSHLLHSRFYEAWVQPEIVGAPRGKISVPVDVRIDARGRVVSFKPLRLSAYPKIDASVVAVGRRVRKVAPPPTSGGEFKLRINFDLDVKR